MSAWGEYGFDDLTFGSERMLVYGLNKAVVERAILASTQLNFDEQISQIEMLPCFTRVYDYANYLERLDHKISGLARNYFKNSHDDIGNRQHWSFGELATELGEELVDPVGRLTPTRMRRYFEQRRRMVNLLRYAPAMDAILAHYYRTSESHKGFGYSEAADSWGKAKWEKQPVYRDIKSIVHAQWDYGYQKFGYEIQTYSAEIENKSKFDRDLSVQLFLKTKAISLYVFDSSALGQACNIGDVVLYQSLIIPANTLVKSIPKVSCPANNAGNPTMDNGASCGFTADDICVFDGASTLEFID